MIRVLNHDYYKGKIDLSFLDYKKYLISNEEIQEIKNKIPNNKDIDESSSDVHIIYSVESERGGNINGYDNKSSNDFDEKGKE